MPVTPVTPLTPDALAVRALLAVTNFTLVLVARLPNASVTKTTSDCAPSDQPVVASTKRTCRPSALVQQPPHPWDRSLPSRRSRPWRPRCRSRRSGPSDSGWIRRLVRRSRRRERTSHPGRFPKAVRPSHMPPRSLQRPASTSSICASLPPVSSHLREPVLPIEVGHQSR